MINIAIFASGNGSNAQRIAEYFKDDPDIKVCRIYCNNPDAFVIQRADQLEIPCTVFNKADLIEPGKVLLKLQDDATDWIVLAGFLWLIPGYLIKQFAHRIINIHPALLPKYGGRGMFGARVHEAVIQNGEKESGISIHYVNEHYDEGQIIFQARCSVKDHDTPVTLASRIHQLEYKHYPIVIENLVKSNDPR
jgi:phosphoribosylglycinamide formyltransferase-1